MIVLLRHGRTNANLNGLLQGRLDPPLDAVGEAQAAAAASFLGSVDLIVASPLRRARQTADFLDGEVREDQRFMEIAYGDWEGRPLAEVSVETFSRWRADVDFKPPGGESLREAGVRVRAGLHDLTAEAIDKTIVIVSHVSPIKAACAWALGVSESVTWRMFVSQASITRIDTSRATPQLIEFNSTGHL